MLFSESSKRWLVWLAVVVLIVAVRTGWVLYERSRPVSSKQPTPRLTEKDYLTVIPKFNVSDLESAKKLVGQRLWVKAGYVAEYTRYSALAQTAGVSPGKTFEPLEEITVRNIIERPLAPNNRQREVLLLFAKGSEEFATVIGYFDPESKQYQIQLDDLFYMKNPHEIYGHWDEQTWQKIRNHQLERHMTFAQVNFSLGTGNLVTTEAGGTQLYQFDRRPGGEPGKTRVRFVDGRVKEFEVKY
jgi:hypothetical protein